MLYEGDNMMGVKRTNRSAALRILHERGCISRKRLAESIKLTPAAITKIVGEMIAEGLVVEGSTIPGEGVGRREVMVELNTRYSCALGILIKPGKAVLSGAWLDGSAIFIEELELAGESVSEESLGLIVDRLMELADSNELPRELILGIGVTLRGAFDKSGRRVVNSYGLLDGEDFPICDIVEQLSGLPVVLSTGIRALFSAHSFLSGGNNPDSQFFLRCDAAGIDSALSINNRICLGSSRQCGEIGHIPVIRRGGKACSCGKCGCLETVASPEAIREDSLAILSEEVTPVLWKMSRSKKPEDFTLDNILDAARHGDSGVCAVVDNAVFALANALRSVIYLVDPGRIVLYGEMFENSYYLSKLQAEMREGVDAGHVVAIETSMYNCQLENIAAAVMAVDDFFAKGGIA